MKIMITLKFPATQFKKDFLECEAAKGLGVRGDTLCNHIKDEYISDTRNKKTLIFSENIMYICKRVGNDVVLIGA